MKFLQLSEHDRLSLLQNVVVEDGSTVARDIDKPLLSIFRYAITRGQEDSFLKQLKGWWAGIAVRLLDGSLPAITGHDLQSYVEDLVDQHRADNLPVSLEIQNSPFVEGDAKEFHDREFVQQLFWIALDNRRLWKAVRDYHRSYAQRSEWLRHNLISEIELDRFACALHDEWEQIFDEKVEQFSSGEINDAQAGREVLSLLARDARARLRERFDQPWFTRGMLHAVADGYAGYRIGWHPDFQMKLESMLADVSS
ncbi:ABC-three component system protein [Amycolatopsis sp. NPDC001319]|uniref:ABC-three component system protein n=1 Tax=unclassified Amycolatopsis TaxID=2618356 RepID=UPI003676F593